ncbi:unnamed protein product [Darwinula stevensoni]|uniref:Uncharacterized protein n=1 Tax=Darwinula stevensoni TaxID=69355 RepID=A0A7R9ACE7_9CRUS|nr:unnamed protein product [Darwinula stevensoni]CAG0900122.1 unnamed protein product [Darwinula stevensoni]
MDVLNSWRQSISFVLVFSFVDADGFAGFDAFRVAADTGLVVGSYGALCRLGTGATFVRKGIHQPEDKKLRISRSTLIASYDDLLLALVEGRQMTIAAIATDCVHPLPPEVIVAEGGSTYYQYYVVPDGTGLAVEWPGLSLSEVEGQTVFAATRAVIRPDGSAGVFANAFNALTGEDEFPHPGGFQCVLGESVKFFYASGDAIEAFETHDQVDSAFMDGKEVRLDVYGDLCEGAKPLFLSAGAEVLAWVREEAGDSPGIHFSQSIADLAGDIVVQDFRLGPEGMLHATIAVFDPVDPGDVPDVSAFNCTLGDAAKFSAPDYDRAELTDFASVLAAQLSGAKLLAEMDLSECVDPTGQVDLSGVTVGAYLRDLVVLGPGTPEARIFLSAFAVHSDPIGGLVYETFSATVDENGNALVYPGLWRFGENGEWGDDFRETVLECALGEGVRIFEALIPE